MLPNSQMPYFVSRTFYASNEACPGDFEFREIKITQMELKAIQSCLTFDNAHKIPIFYHFVL